MKVIILGAATAGMTAASKLKRTLQDKVEIVAYQKAAYPSFGACGIPYFIGDEFNDPNTMIARTSEQFLENGIKVNLNCEAIKIDFDSKTVLIKDNTNNKEYTDNYDKLIITTGATGKKLSYNASNIYTCVSMEDAIKIKSEIKPGKKAVIIGAGFIGLEVCEAFVNRGINVSLVEANQWTFQQAFDQQTALLIEQELIKHEVNYYANAKIKDIVINNNIANKVILEDKQVIECDFIIYAIGFSPNTAFLKDTKLHLASNQAIITNQYQETDIKDVYSAGDCSLVYNRILDENVYLPLATIAAKQGKVIANNIIKDRSDKFQGTIATSIVRVFDLQVARTGLTFQQAQARNIDCQTITIQANDHTDYVKDPKLVTITVVYSEKQQVIYGVQIAGYNKTVLRIYGFIPLIWSKIKLTDLEHLDWPYSPPFAKSVDIMNIVLSKICQK